MAQSGSRFPNRLSKCLPRWLGKTAEHRVPRTRREREGIPLSIRGPAIIAVDGYARATTCTSKRGELLQIRSGFCIHGHLLARDQTPSALFPKNRI